MAQRTAATVKNATYAGEAGNLSVDHGTFTAVAAAIADTIDLLTIPAGSKLLDVKFVNAALGATSTLGYGWRFKDGSVGGSAVALLAQTSTAAAAMNFYAGAPIQFDKEAILYATVAGAAITGQIDVVTNYEYRGMK